MSTSATYLIVGGNGKTGARVDARLRALGLTTRPASRSSKTPFDWERRETWGAALDGVDKAYVTYHPDIAIVQAAADIAEFGRLAKSKGIEQVVLLSGRGEPGAQRAEEALKASGVASTILRSSWFNQNFSEGYLIDGVLAGEIMLPAAPVPEPFVDVEDIAEVAVAALTDDRHLNKLYELTGPRALTFGEAIGEISTAIGREIRYARISAEDFAAGMRQANVPDNIIALLNELFAEVLDGRNSQVMSGVQEVLGRPARDFYDFARAAADAGAWQS
jgi:uncharacterized protein YbjT (DUF2867 family)